MDCRKNIDYINRLPDEIFKFICHYWLRYETQLAKERFFDLLKTAKAVSNGM